MTNGKSLSKGGIYTVYQGIDSETSGDIKYVGITKRNPKVGWKEHYASGTDRATLDYYSIENGLTKEQARQKTDNPNQRTTYAPPMLLLSSS